MTLDQWLQEATGTFPRGVRERLAQEYTAHLEDSVAAGGSGDALELFGDPFKVWQALSKSYVHSKRLEQIEGRNRAAFWTGTAFILVQTIYETLLARDILSWVRLGLCVSILVIILALSHRWPKVRREAFRLSILPFPYLFPFLPMILSIHKLIVILPFSVVILIQLFAARAIIDEDERIRRTLQLEEISLDRRRINLHPDR